jgi:hypothetical protein
LSALIKLCGVLDVSKDLKYQQTKSFYGGYHQRCPSTDGNCEHEPPLALVVEREGLPVKFLTSMESWVLPSGAVYHSIHVEPYENDVIATSVHEFFTMAQRFGRGSGWGPGFSEIDGDINEGDLHGHTYEETVAELKVALDKRIVGYLDEFAVLYFQKLEEVQKEQLLIEARIREDLENPL